MLIVVSDTTAITNLAAIHRLDLLRELYGQINVPEAVYHELVRPGETNPGAYEVQTEPWIVTRTVANRAMVERLLADHTALALAEVEAIVLAYELRADLLIIDEGAGRAVAESLDLAFTGVLGSLLDANERLLIPAIRPIVEALIANGFWIDPRLYVSILKMAGEA